MRILVTGNMGYVGSIVVRQLRRHYPQATIIGYDSGFFAHCLTNSSTLPETDLDQQLFGDVRDITADILRGVTVVIHLAAVSNDPMGKRFEVVTEDINQKASLRIAEIARDAGVKNFVFASSCSVYGATEGGPRKETDELNPLTAYARSKIGTENGLRQMPLSGMAATCLRFATACGMSDRLRLDLVVNDFVACAVTTKEITVLSDGSPWRPLIDVRDMARAIEWAALRTPAQGGQYLAINAGADNWNFQVRDLAQAVATEVPGTKLSINTAAPPDKRSYRVDFGMFRSLAPNHQPLAKIADTIAGLRDGLQSMRFNNPEFRNSTYMRLVMLEEHIKESRLNTDLHWNRHEASSKRAVSS
jgi:nucleoside-diphosphate-sugar epimerase